MSKDIESKRVSTGLNVDLGVWKDNHYVTCSNCGFICHTDRDSKGKEDSRQGWGTDLQNYTTSSIVLLGAFWGPSAWGSDYWGSPTTYDVDPVVVGGCSFCGCLLYTKEVFW